MSKVRLGRYLDEVLVQDEVDYMLVEEDMRMEIRKE